MWKVFSPVSGVYKHIFQPQRKYRPDERENALGAKDKCDFTNLIRRFLTVSNAFVPSRVKLEFSAFEKIQSQDRSR